MTARATPLSRHARPARVTRARPAVGLLLAAVVVGCGTARRGEPVGPPVAVAADEALEVGRQVFATHCHACHPGGTAGLGPGLNDKPLPKSLIKLQVRRGLGAMPASPDERIDDAQLDALVTYLKAMRAAPVEGVAVSR